MSPGSAVAPNDPVPGRVEAAMGLAVLALAALVSLRLVAPPQPAAVEAPAASFSAVRAMAHVRALAPAPRPPGTAEHEAARDRLLAALAELGLRPQVQRTTVARAIADRHLIAASVANVVARLPGREGGPAVLLMAHYDSRPTTPGAGDDAAGVAAVIETVRALRAREVPRRDIIVLLTDAEEGGLLGARAFVDEHAWMADVGVVINLEARGQRGPAIMFQTVGGASAPLIEGLRKSGARPVASSLTADVYRRLPNDTDLTPFGRAGVAGFDVAFIGGLPAYHTALDRVQGLDPASLQQLGETALGLVLRFAEHPLDSQAVGSAVYFDLAGGPIVAYPAWAAVPLAALATALLVVAVVVVRRRRGLRAGALLGALVRTLTAGVALVVVAAAVWWLTVRVAPGLVRGPYGEPYDGGWLAVALVLIGAAPACWLLAGGRSISRPATLACAALMPWALAALVASLVSPGISFVATWPLAAAAVGVLVGALAPPGRLWLVGALVLGALPGVALVAPIAALLRDALGMGAVAVVAVVAGVLPMLLAAPLLGALGRGSDRRSVRGPLVLLLVGTVLLVALIARDRPGRARPYADTLTYRLDADAAEAAWLSFDNRSSGWTRSFLADAARVAAGFPVPGSRTVLSAPAPALELAPPTAEAITDQAGFLRLRVASHRRAPTAWLSAIPADDAGIDALWIGNRRYELGGDHGAPVTVRYFGLPTTGAVISFERRGTVTLEVADQRYGLPTELLPAPPPAERIAKPFWLTDSTLVVARYTFDG